MYSMVYLLLILILPVLLAGITFIFFLKWNRNRYLNQPLDLGITINGLRLFGNNKTIQGPLFMSIGTSLFGFLVCSILKNSLPFQLSPAQTLLSYFLVGISYSIGELPNSFLKRRLSIPPGKAYPKGFLRILFKIFDTFDSLIAITVCYILLFKIDYWPVLIALAAGGFLHLLTDTLMIKLHLKKLH